MARRLLRQRTVKALPNPVRNFRPLQPRPCREPGRTMMTNQRNPAFPLRRQQCGDRDRGDFSSFDRPAGAPDYGREPGDYSRDVRDVNRPTYGDYSQGTDYSAYARGSTYGNQYSQDEDLYEDEWYEEEQPNAYAGAHARALDNVDEPYDDSRRRPELGRPTAGDYADAYYDDYDEGYEEEDRNRRRGPIILFTGLLAIAPSCRSADLGPTPGPIRQIPRLKARRAFRLRRKRRNHVRRHNRHRAAPILRPSCSTTALSAIRPWRANGSCRAKKSRLTPADRSSPSRYSRLRPISSTAGNCRFPCRLRFPAAPPARCRHQAIRADRRALPRRVRRRTRVRFLKGPAMKRLSLPA